MNIQTDDSPSASAYRVVYQMSNPKGKYEDIARVLQHMDGVLLECARGNGAYHTNPFGLLGMQNEDCARSIASAIAYHFGFNFRDYNPNMPPVEMPHSTERLFVRAHHVLNQSRM